MNVTIGMRLALAASRLREEKLRKAQSRLAAIIDETERQPLVERVHADLGSLWDPACSIDMENAGHWLHSYYEAEVAPWLDRNELAFRVVSGLDVEGISGSEDLHDGDLGIMVVASAAAEAKAEALRALATDAADRLTPEEIAALDGFLGDPLGVDAFNKAKPLLGEIKVTDPTPPFSDFLDEM